MRNSTWILVIFAAFLACVQADCSATVAGKARTTVGGSFDSNGVSYQLYDISVNNTGTETITELFAFFAFPSTSSLYQTWNYNGSTVFNGAGFILAGSNTPTVAFVTPICSASTSAPSTSPTSTPTSSATTAPTSTPTSSATTTAPTSSATASPTSSATSAPTSSATSSPTSSATSSPTSSATSSPTSTPTSSATSAPTSSPSCNIGASLRLGSSWTTDGVDFASYYLFLSNNGECDLTHYVTSFALNGGEITESWNLKRTLGGYAVRGFGGVLHSNDTYGGAGFNAKLGGDIQITPYGSTCQC